ncbi:MAG TPA: DUF2181 domain-containing protein [Kofleriaceae bacterium]
MSGRSLLERGGTLRFVHAVNSRARLDRFLADARLNAFEADVSWGFVASAPGVLLPIMAHPPIDRSDLTFVDWLDGALAGERVVKVDIKDQPTNRAVLDILAERDLPRDRFILNADVTAGPGGEPALFTPDDAVEWRRRFGEVVISIGCTTGPDLGPYARAHVDLLLDAAAAVGEPATICLDVHRVESDPSALDRLVAEHRHVTLWNQFPADGLLFRRYRERLPAAFIDLFDGVRDPIVE